MYENTKDSVKFLKEQERHFSPLYIPKILLLNKVDNIRGNNEYIVHTQQLAEELRMPIHAEIAARQGYPREAMGLILDVV